LAESAFYFQQVVWPRITGWTCFDGMTLVPNEGVADRGPTRMLDAVGGIDYWLLRDEPAAVLGLASRVLSGGPVYETFTVGDAELEKRRTAFDLGPAAVRPHFHVQACVDRTQNRLLWAACARTEDLFRFMEENPERIIARRNKMTGQRFKVIWLDELKEADIDIWDYSSYGTTYRTKDGRDLYVPEDEGTFGCDVCGCRSTLEQREADWKATITEACRLLMAFRPPMTPGKAVEFLVLHSTARAMQDVDPKLMPSNGRTIRKLHEVAMEMMSFSEAPWTATWVGRCHRCGAVTGVLEAARDGSNHGTA
jgi:hypothetical protein